MENVFVFIEILFKMLLFKGGVLIYAEHLYVNPLLLTEIEELYLWQTLQKKIAGEEAITHRD